MKIIFQVLVIRCCFWAENFPCFFTCRCELLSDATFYDWDLFAKNQKVELQMNLKLTLIQIIMINNRTSKNKKLSK